MTCVVGCPVHDVRDGDIHDDGDTGVSQAVDSDVLSALVVPVISPLGSVDVVVQRVCRPPGL